ncbi:MAG: DUF134 domain-containing protein [Candidatus Bipolaricaulia bacterium]
MPRRRKRRRCGLQPQVGWFHPTPTPGVEQRRAVELELDELEAMRLVDLLRKDQSAAGEEMGISRGTVQRLLYSGRRKVTQALLEGRPIRIKGSEQAAFQCATCGWERPTSPPGSDGFFRCPRCGSPYAYRPEQSVDEEVS